VSLGSVVMWALAKQTCGSLQKSIMLLGFDFVPPYQIGHIFLNGLRRQDSTRDKTQIKTRIDELLVALDPEHQVLASEAPP